MSDDSSDDDSYGPALPPHLQAKRPIGPQLPAAFLQKNDSEKNGSVTSTSANTSEKNTLPKTDALVSKSREPEEKASDSASDSDGDIGPYPPDDPRSHRMPKPQLRKPTETSTKLKREEWMLIPPKNKTISEVIGQVGLTSRKFLGRTPDEVEAPTAEDGGSEPDFLDVAKAEFEEKLAQERDERMDAMLKVASAGKSKESLLHIHQKRRKIEDEGPKERRPFDRDIDLKVSGLSEEDKQKFIKKTSELTSRFHGGKQKFL